MNAKWAAVLVLLVLVLIAGWLLSRRGDDRYSDDREVAKAQKEFVEMVQEQQATDPSGGDAVMRISSDKLGERIEKLDDSQRQDFAQGLMPNMMAMMQERFQRVLDLPPDEQKQELDRIIDQQQSRRERIDEMLAENQGVAQSSSVETSGDANNGRVGVANRVAVDGNTEQGQRWLMDNMSAEQRATMEEYVKLVKARLEERGLNSDDVPISVAIGVGGPN